MDIFHCQEEKPNLESLTLQFDHIQSHVPLSLIYRFVDENSNLKSLTLHGLSGAGKTMQDLLDTLTCKHSLEEFELAWTCKNRTENRFFAKRNWKKIPREKFPDLIRDLKKCIIRNALNKNSH